MATEMTETEVLNKAAKSFKPTVFYLNQEETSGKKNPRALISLDKYFAHIASSL